MVRKQSFTLIEIVFAIAIFSTVILVLIERRNESLENTHYSIRLLEAQKIVDEVMADYYLHPFSTEAKPLEKDYSPFEVEVNVSIKEKPPVVPEALRPPEDIFAGANPEEEEKDKRIILDINVKVHFGTLTEPKSKKYTHEVHTLIRHIELEDEEDGTN